MRICELEGKLEETLFCENLGNKKFSRLEGRIRVGVVEL
jgi:hypothetical protein